jgi:hypothetical protein
MLVNTVSNIPEEIFKFLTIEATRLGKESGFQKRRSKLKPSAFIKSLITLCLSEHFTLEMFCSALKAQKICIRKQSLNERFNKQTVEYLKALSLFCLKHFQTEKLPQLDGLEQFSGLNIIDSSVVSLHSALRELFKGCGGAASRSAMKIQMMFDYLSGQIKELTLTSGCANDQGFDNYFKVIEKGALYLIDLGYFKLNTFKKIAEEKAFFVSRLLSGTKLLTQDNEPFDLCSTLTSAGPLFSQQVLVGANHKIPVRLVAYRLPPDIAEQRRRRLREDHRRRGSTPSKESLALQDWSIYITNCSETQIDDKDIHPTYALRWQIELLFKLSKSLMHIDSINTKNPARVIIETYGKFITMMLFFLLCNPVRHSKEGKQLSFYKACQQLKSRASEFMRALASPYRLKLFLMDFYETLALFASKDFKKKPPLGFDMTKRDGF